MISGDFAKRVLFAKITNMNKFNLISTISVIVILGGILLFSQKDTLGNKLTGSILPTLPPESQTFAKNGQQDQQQQASQQQTATDTGIQGPLNASVSATIKTSKGDIDIILFGREAPNAVANFINKSKAGFYKNKNFHRVEGWVVQGGDPLANGTGGNAIQTELNNKPFLTGSLGMAASSQMQIGQGARVSNDSQFFITKSEADWLDNQYTNFGIVTSGMSVVNKIEIGDKILGVEFE